MAALSLGCEPDLAGCVVALALYVWWSAGWRRALTFALAAAVGGAAYGSTSGIQAAWKIARGNQLIGWRTSLPILGVIAAVFVFKFSGSWSDRLTHAQRVIVCLLLVGVVGTSPSIAGIALLLLVLEWLERAGRRTRLAACCLLVALAAAAIGGRVLALPHP